MSSTANNAISRDELEHWLDTTLQVNRFRDYAPNGLQVEGTATVRHIVTGVTASQALIQAAIERGADTLLVHHGWFWKNESPCVRGPKRERMSLVLANHLNLFGYHLPLDAHPELGNNAQLARILGFTPDLDDDGQPITCGPDNLIWLGRCKAQTLKELDSHVFKSLRREPLTVGNTQQLIERVAWCTGGAQGMMQAAVDQGVDAYITGEASEQNFHQAHESGTAFIAAGHHATERYGIKALGEAIQARFNITVDFIDLDNPI